MKNFKENINEVIVNVINKVSINVVSNIYIPHPNESRNKNSHMCGDIGRFYRKICNNINSNNHEQDFDTTVSTTTIVTLITTTLLILSQK